MKSRALCDHYAVVRKVDNAFFGINLYSVNIAIAFLNIYPFDRVIQPLNNRDQWFHMQYKAVPDDKILECDRSN